MSFLSALCSGTLLLGSTGPAVALLINDPWPPKRGDIYGIILGDYLRYNPTAVRYVLHR
jgi:hypothetical protein